jgi:hypothetical protein
MLPPFFYHRNLCLPSAERHADPCFGAATNYRQTGHAELFHLPEKVSMLVIGKAVRERMKRHPKSLLECIRFALRKQAQDSDCPSGCAIASEVRFKSLRRVESELSILACRSANAAGRNADKRSAADGADQ